jgi:hypothetical protein
MSKQLEREVTAAFVRVYEAVSRPVYHVRNVDTSKSRCCEVMFCVGDIRLVGWSLYGASGGEVYRTERVDVRVINRLDWGLNWRTVALKTVRSTRDATPGHRTV